MAEVIQAHTAVDDDELTLTGGQKVKVTHRDNSGWWKGEVEGKRGMFPGHCVKLIKEDEKIKQVNTTCIKEGRGGGKDCECSLCEADQGGRKDKTGKHYMY